MAVYKTQVTPDPTVELSNVLGHFPAWDVMVTSMSLGDGGDHYVLTLNATLTEEQREHLNVQEVS